jgi:hypothetical protein
MIRNEFVDILKNKIRNEKVESVNERFLRNMVKKIMRN